MGMLWRMGVAKQGREGAEGRGAEQQHCTTRSYISLPGQCITFFKNAITYAMPLKQLIPLLDMCFLGVGDGGLDCEWATMEKEEGMELGYVTVSHELVLQVS